MTFKQIILTFYFILSFSAVFSQEKNKNLLFEQPGYHFSYSLSHPNKKWELHKSLREISGLTYINRQRIACVQDEQGTIYVFNLKKGEVETKINFGKHGDYEGIEIIGNDAWILKSNGTLYRVINYLKQENPKVRKYKTGLSEKNNAEGLAYDDTDSSLLIACKGYPYTEERTGENAKNFKAIYRFHLRTKETDPSPFLQIHLDSIKRYKNYSIMTLWGIELLSFFDPAEGDVSFQPSAIAIHPSTGNLYILASVGKSLIIYSPKGKMLAFIQLGSKVHSQPEGICFAPDGTLFIANEGKDKKGIIYKFTPIAVK